jgi:hypothetical protein
VTKNLRPSGAPDAYPIHIEQPPPATPAATPPGAGSARARQPSRQRHATRAVIGFGAACRGLRSGEGEGDALAGCVAGGAPAAWPGCAWQRRVRGAPAWREGTPHLTTLARLARIARVREENDMIGRPDCAKGFWGERFSAVHGDAVIRACDSASLNPIIRHSLESAYTFPRGADAVDKVLT